MSRMYDRNLRSPKFYGNSINVGRLGYNPEIICYYDGSDHLMRQEETFDGKVYTQTISGTTLSGANHFTTYWPDYSYKITYGAWVETDL